MKIRIKNNNIKTDDISIYNDGEKYSYNNKGKYHNVDGPSFEFRSGDETWWFDDDYHRKYGPTRKWRDSDEWWFDGEYYSMEEFMEKFL